MGYRPSPRWCENRSDTGSMIRRWEVRARGTARRVNRSNSAAKLEPQPAENAGQRQRRHLCRHQCAGEMDERADRAAVVGEMFATGWIGRRIEVGGRQLGPGERARARRKAALFPHQYHVAALKSAARNAFRLEHGVIPAVQRVQSLTLVFRHLSFAPPERRTKKSHRSLALLL